jgi:hypothetical protein
MASTVWFKRKDQRAAPDRDRSTIYREAKALDKLAEGLRVTKPSLFFDWATVKASLADEDERWVEGHEKWHSASEMMTTLSAIYRVLERGPSAPVSESTEEIRLRLLDEIKECLEKAHQAAADGIGVHLAVVP